MVNIEKMSCGSQRVSADVGISDLDWESSTKAEYAYPKAEHPLLVELARRHNEFVGGPSTVCLGVASYGGGSNIFLNVELAEADFVHIDACRCRKGAERIKFDCIIPAGECRAVCEIEIG